MQADNKLLRITIMIALLLLVLVGKMEQVQSATDPEEEEIEEDQAYMEAENKQNQIMDEMVESTANHFIENVHDNRLEVAHSMHIIPSTIGDASIYVIHTTNKGKEYQHIIVYRDGRREVLDLDSFPGWVLNLEQHGGKAVTIINKNLEPTKREEAINNARVFPTIIKNSEPTKKEAAIKLLQIQSLKARKTLKPEQVGSIVTQSQVDALKDPNIPTNTALAAITPLRLNALNASRNEGEMLSAEQVGSIVTQFQVDALKGCRSHTDRV